MSLLRVWLEFILVFANKKVVVLLIFQLNFICNRSELIIMLGGTGDGHKKENHQGISSLCNT